MCSFVTILALALPGATSLNSINWHTHYGVAKAAGVSKQKPLIMFIASGKEGWNKILANGSFNSEIRRLLNEKYVALYVDQQTEEGKKLGNAFEVHGHPALIISSRTGDVQVFRHEGSLSQTDLTLCLNRYSTAGLVVYTTESLFNVTNQVSTAYAPPVQAAYPTYYAPAFGGCST
jgi:hypothetical protein